MKSYAQGRQIPLTFDLSAEPPEGLKAFCWRLREDGRNWHCEVEVDPPLGGTTIRWESLVLVPDREPVAHPQAMEPGAPPILPCTSIRKRC